MSLLELQKALDDSLYSEDGWLKSQILYREMLRDKVYVLQGKKPFRPMVARIRR